MRETLTSPEGLYRIPSLGPGSYTLTVEKPGFASAERSSVTLGVSQTSRLDVALSVGALTERVDVAATIGLLETEQGRVSGHINETQIKELPINGRNVLNLIAIQPGIVGRGLSAGLYSGGGSDSFSGETQPSVFANGQRFEGNNYTLDDTNTNGEARNGVTNIVPNSEAVEEVRITANNFSAVDGRNPGAQVQMLTRAGTNQFHGVGAYYFVNNTLASRGIFDPGQLPSIRKHLYDAAFGGPIIKQPDLLLFLARRTAAGRRAHRFGRGGDAPVPRLHSADATQLGRGVPAEELRADRRSDRQYPRPGHAPGRCQPVRQHAGRHPRHRHGLLHAGRVTAMPISSPSASTTNFAPARIASTAATSAPSTTRSPAACGRPSTRRRRKPPSTAISTTPTPSAPA